MALVDKYPLEKTKPIKKTIASTVLIFVFLLIGSIISVSVISLFFVFAGIMLIPLIIFFFVMLFVLVYTYQVYYMKTYFYDMTDKLLIIRKGVFSRNEINLPFNRLQDIYVDQDILDRMFGLYDVHVSSATAVSGFLSHIDGVNKENSEAIKKLILKKIHRK